MNIADRRFVYNKRTDLLTRFREKGWQPPEKAAEEAEADLRREGAIRALQQLEREETASRAPGAITKLRVA